MTAPATSVFISINGLLDPLGASQILPYLERLNRDWPVHILSYERADRLSVKADLDGMIDRLARQDIGWTRHRYHTGPRLIASTWDLMSGVVAVRRMMSRFRVGLLHGRAHLPTEIARIAGGHSTPLLYDIRGLMPAEYVDGGIWREGELKWQLAKAAENRFFKRADAAVVLTHNILPDMRTRFADLGRHPDIEVVPCCVDMDRFQFNPVARERVRAELRVQPQDVLLVYSGSIGTWYLPDAMARLAAAVQKHDASRTVHMLWMVNNDQERCKNVSAAAGIDPSRVHVLHAKSERVPEYLSAADAGLALIRPSYSKRFSSPTKYAEYLSVGLPIAIHADVGDGAQIVTEMGAVDVEVDCDADGFARAATELCARMQQPREYFRTVARKLFDIDTVALPSYQRLYRRLLGPPSRRKVQD